MTQLSIIVPVYNVEKYIRTCIESIYRQRLDDSCFEVIIVNDGTQDRSMEVIEDIIEKHTNISIINQENLSLSVARNNGIAAAKGEYVLMPDSDDLLISNSLRPLLEKALETKADLVVADYLVMYDQEIEDLDQHIPQQSEPTFVEKTGKQLFMEDLNPHHCYVWRTLYRREYLVQTDIKFVPCIRYQDVPFTHECYLRASKCLRTSWLLSIYRKGHDSATSTFDLRRAKDFSIAIGKTWELTRMQGLSNNEQKKLRDDIFTSFSTMVRFACHYMKDASERVKTLDFLKIEAPDLEFGNGRKQRVMTFLVKNIPHTLMRICHFYVRVFEDNILPFYYHRLRRPLLER